MGIQTPNRRDVIVLSAAIAATLGLPRAVMARSTPATIAGLIDQITGGKAPDKSRVVIDAPKLAENGNNVPIEISVDSPMTSEDYVTAVMLFSEANPWPRVAVFHFTPMSGQAFVYTRIRLARLQNIVALAVMNDGSAYFDKKQIDVSIGGCGADS